jgi:3-methyladenine DNA glycosylase/8-oxoguanine DNA glycosylase
VHVTDPKGAFEKGRRHLLRRDPRLAAHIKKMGRRRPNFDPRDPFHALVRAVLSQQLSTKAADTIESRVIALVGGGDGLNPESLLALSPDALRAAGVSRPKISYLRDLAQHVVDGKLDLHGLKHQSDDEIIAAITAIKGFGRWSAEMFLIFCLNRPDVFPVGDLGIVKGVQLLTGMKRRPKPRTMARCAEAWRPHRSVASWYLWRLLE